MAQQQTKTLKMMYSGELQHISCPIKAKYEECIEIARQRFEIPLEFRNSIQISNGSRYVFGKHTFEYFNLLFPNPEIIFHIKLDYNGLMERTSDSEDRTLLNKLSNKRKYNEDIEHEGVPVTRQNCFMGFIPGTESPDSDAEETAEPKPKRQKLILSKNRTIAKKASSRKSIRI